MMECLEFRRQAGADPQHLAPEARDHAATCLRCTGHLAALLALDERILAALQVPVEVPGAAAAPGRGRAAIAILDRRRWMALAASIIGGVLVGTLLWVGGPRNSLAQDLIEHLDHEPEALVATNRPEEDTVLGKVLERGGIRLRPDTVLVSYASSCLFRGDTVPHLVVQTTDGPVTVMMLRNEKPASPVRFDEQGYSGRIVPAGPGSIAVIGADGADLKEITARVLAAVEWLED
jgi:hypothetical protein